VGTHTDKLPNGGMERSVILDGVTKKLKTFRGFLDRRTLNERFRFINNRRPREEITKLKEHITKIMRDREAKAQKIPAFFKVSSYF